MNDLTHCRNGHEYTEENSYFSPGGVRWCRLCRQQRAVEYSLNRKYGLSTLAFEKLLNAQNGQCAVCQELLDKASTMRDPTVDHDHNTGKIRGILCRRCNQGLGQFHDSTVVLRAAIAYLENPNPGLSDQVQEISQ